MMNRIIARLRFWHRTHPFYQKYTPSIDAKCRNTYYESSDQYSKAYD